MRFYRFLVSVVTLVGCSTQVVSPTECEDNRACRTAFGVGFVCGGAGYCESLQLPVRCRAYPEDLLENPGEESTVVLGALTDSSSPAERAALRAQRLVVSLASRQGGLGAHRVGLVDCDIREASPDAFDDGWTRPEAARRMSTFLLEELGAPAVIGPHSSADSAVVFDEVARQQPAMVMSPAAASEALTRLDRFPASELAPGLLWRTTPPEGALVRAMADSVVEREVSSVFIVAVEGEGQTSSNLFQEALAERGGTVTTEARFYIPGSQAELVDAVNAAAEASTQEIVVFGDTENESLQVARLIAGDERFAGRSLLMSAKAAVPELLVSDNSALFGPGTEGVYRLRVARYRSGDTIAFRNFRNQYRAEYDGEDPGPYASTARAYDAAWLLLFGTAAGEARTGAIDATGMSLGLRSLIDTSASPVPLEQASWRAAQIALASGETLNVEGASGSLDFDERTEELSAAPELVVVSRETGRWAFREEPEPVGMME